MGERLPHNLEAEQFVLGALMVENAVAGDLDGFLKAEHFFDPVHGLVYKIILKRIRAGLVADPLTIRDEALALSALDELGGEAYLRELAIAVPAISAARSYAAAIVDCAARRALIEAAASMSEQAADHAWDVDPGAAAADLMDKLADFAALRDGGRSSVSFGEALRDALGRAETAGRLNADVTGAPTGIGALDASLNGLEPGTVTILAASTGKGKTALAGQIAEHVARTSGPVQYFSLEMRGWSLAMRRLAAGARLDGRRLRRGRMSVGEFDRLHDWAQSSAAVPLTFEQATHAEYGFVLARIRAAARQPEGLKLAVIDYLQLMKGDRRPGRGRHNEIEDMTNAIKALSLELEIPIVVLSQLSRDHEKRQDPRPRLSDLRESGSIEQDADAVIFIWQPNASGWGEIAGMPGKKRLSLLIGKNRNGEADVDIPVIFDGPLTTFEAEVSDQDAVEQTEILWGKEA